MVSVNLPRIFKEKFDSGKGMLQFYTPFYGEKKASSLTSYFFKAGKQANSDNLKDNYENIYKGDGLNLGIRMYHVASLICSPIDVSINLIGAVVSGIFMCLAIVLDFDKQISYYNFYSQCCFALTCSLKDVPLNLAAICRIPYLRTISSIILLND